MKDKIRELLFRIFAKEILAATAPPIQIKVETVKPVEFKLRYLKNEAHPEAQKAHYQGKLLENLKLYIEESSFEQEVELSIWVIKRK